MATSRHTNPQRGIPRTLKIFGLFVVSMGVLLAAMGWLGWRLITQERLLDDQRLREQLDNTAGLAVRELERALASWEERLPALAEGKAAPPPRTTALVFDDLGVVRQAGIPLPYVPQAPVPAAQSSADPFAAAEKLEFASDDLARAERTYRDLSRAKDPAVKAGALMRLARTLRREHRQREALSPYAALATLGPATWVAGAPAEFVARRERIELYHALDDAQNAEREARELTDLLWSGRYSVDRATFEFYAEGLSRPPGRDAGMSLASGLDALWPEVQARADGRAATGAGNAAVVVWRRLGPGSALIVGDITAVVSQLGGLTLPGYAIALEDARGATMWAMPGSAGAASLLEPGRKTGLPWSVRVGATDAAASIRRSRKTLLIAGFLFAALVVIASGAAMFRAVNHELSVARLQSEFVAAVSHEFRTPLTAMRHLTDLLDEGQVSPERAPRYYRALVKETRRLQALVESLLDFGRMEAGRRTYRMEDADFGDIVREAIEAMPESQSGRLRFDSALAPRERMASVDREAIGLAVRNLIDNALKYSPQDAPVHVALGRDGGSLLIAVADQGPGIDPGERRDIFRTFVRGSAAADRRVKGTGLGLAMADRIVRAHDGEIRVTSERARGSTFTIAVPAPQAPETAAATASIEGALQTQAAVRPVAEIPAEADS